jgi:hypothetical protein
VVQYCHFMESVAGRSAGLPLEARAGGLDEQRALHNDSLFLSSSLSDVMPFPAMATRIGSSRKVLDASLLSILDTSPSDVPAVANVSALTLTLPPNPTPLTPFFPRPRCSRLWKPSASGSLVGTPLSCMRPPPRTSLPTARTISPQRRAAARPRSSTSLAC